MSEMRVQTSEQTSRMDTALTLVLLPLALVIGMVLMVVLAYLAMIGLVLAGEGVAALSLVDAVVLVGIGAVLPLALGGPWWRWALATVSAFVSFSLTGVWAGLFIVPAVAACLAAVVTEIRRAGPLHWWGPVEASRVIATLYAVVAAGALAQSRLDLTLFDVHEPIVELTAVHFIFAGCAALVLAGATYETRPHGLRSASRAAIVATAAAPPIVASGFVSGWAALQVGGALVMTAGVCLTATLELRAAPWLRPWYRAVLLAVSGLAVWVPMVLAVAWASGQHWDVPALSIPDMARTHGLVNAFAFVLSGLVARRLALPVATAAADHADRAVEEALP